MWPLLARKALGVKFRRVHGLPEGVADFYCHSLRLVVIFSDTDPFTAAGYNVLKLEPPFTQEQALGCVGRIRSLARSIRTAKEAALEQARRES